MSKLIPISQGLHVIVDDEDFDRVNQYRWTAAVRSNTTYAYRSFGPKKKRIVQYLHRFLMEPPPGLMVDHKNGNGLDCTRDNMRVATPSQNQHNRKKSHTANTSGVKGVTFYQPLQKWHAQIRLNYANIHLGYFADIVEAAEAYKRASLNLHGEFSNTTG